MPIPESRTTSARIQKKYMEYETVDAIAAPGAPMNGTSTRFISTLPAVTATETRQ